MTNGNNFSGCLTLWMYLLSPAAIQAFELRSPLPCRSGQTPCRRIEKSRLVRNMVAWAPNRLSPQCGSISSSVPVPEDLGSERLGAKTTGRDLALGHVSGSDENRVFYFKTIRNLRREFDVSDGFLGRLMNSLCRQSCTWTGMEIRANVFFETWMWTRSKMYSP